MSVRSVARYALVLGTVTVGVPIVLGTITMGIASGVVLARRARGVGWEAPAATAFGEPVSAGSTRVPEADVRTPVSTTGEPIHR